MKKALLTVLLLSWSGALAATSYPPVDSDARWQSSRNGEWRFQLNGPAREFRQSGFDDSSWARIAVPGNWEMQGFEEPIYKEPREGEGLYRRTFNLPAGWQGRRVILRFDGVLFGYEFWINGERGGSFESGFNRSDFDVTSLCLRSPRGH